MSELTIDRQPQPLGENGVTFSLMKVAEFATASRLDVGVIAQVRRIVRDAGYPTSDLDIARAVWDWMRAKGIRWLRDPARGEFMAHAKHFLCSQDESGKDRDDALLVAGDCDELTILFTALFCAYCQAVGVENVAVLGHAYGSDRMISHVLAAIWTGNEWVRVDPSGDWGFGEYKKATREKGIAVPSCRVICDAEVCFSGPRAVRPPPLDNKGDFVGVKGLPMSEALVTLGAPPAPSPRFPLVGLGDPADDAAMAWAGIMSGNADTVEASLASEDEAHAAMLASFADLGVDPLNNEYGWTEAREAERAALRKVGLFLLMCFREAAAGDRKIAILEGSNDYVIEAKPSDVMAVNLTAGDVLSIVKGLSFDVEAGAIVSSQVSGLPVGVGVPQVALIVAGVVVVALVAGAYFAWRDHNETLRTAEREATQRGITDRATECAAKFSPERCAPLIKAAGDSASSRDREERLKTEAQASQTKWRVAAGIGALALGGGLAAGWYAKQNKIWPFARKAAA